MCTVRPIANLSRALAVLPLQWQDTELLLAAGILMKRAKPEVYMKYVYFVSACTFTVPCLIDITTKPNDGELSSFCVWEMCCSCLPVFKTGH